MPSDNETSYGIESGVTERLSSLIRAALGDMESERTNPVRTTDQSDDFIKFNCERAATLRRIREEFEDEMARVTPFNQ